MHINLSDEKHLMIFQKEKNMLQKHKGFVKKNEMMENGDS
jgi:hypothetical protein